MKTLKEHEDKFWKRYEPPKQWTPCGIECPKCNTELEVDTYVVLTSNPPQRPVRCPNCGYIGSIH